MTAVDTMVVTWTHEKHEKPCQYMDDACSKVAVWRGILDLPCPHNRRLYCDPHKELMVAWDVQGRAWECRYCGAIGWPPIRWERP